MIVSAYKAVLCFYLLQKIQYPEVAIRDNFIGPSQGYLDFHLFGEIKKAFDFECNKLFINYVIETPNGMYGIQISYFNYCTELKVILNDIILKYKYKVNIIYNTVNSI